MDTLLRQILILIGLVLLIVVMVIGYVIARKVTGQ